MQANNVGFIDNGNINESHQGIKKLHLNRKGNSTSAKNLLNYLENFWREVSESDFFLKECISDSSENESDKNGPYFLNVIRKNNIWAYFCSY